MHALLPKSFKAASPRNGAVPGNRRAGSNAH